MPIIRLKNEREILKTFSYRSLIKYRDDVVLTKFNPSTRAKQIAMVKQGREELLKAIGPNADLMERDGMLHLTCFFTMPRGELIPLGVLASYVEKGKGNLLWWKPEDDN